jgi:PTS system mannose-specific IIA component
MIGIVVATHGELGRSLTGTLRMILGEIPGLAAVALETSDSLETFQGKMEKALSEVDPGGEGSFVLVDMLGGTPFNVAFRLSQEKSIQLITGVNLPMLLKAVSHQGDSDIQALAPEVAKAGKDGVVWARDILKGTHQA